MFGGKDNLHGNGLGIGRVFAAALHDGVASGSIAVFEQREDAFIEEEPVSLSGCQERLRRLSAPLSSL